MTFTTALLAIHTAAIIVLMVIAFVEGKMRKTARKSK